MTTLHITGNGFDLSHGIESSYADFGKYAKKYYGDWASQLEACFPVSDYKSGVCKLWSDLEQALGNPDFKAIYDEATEDVEIEEDHEIRYYALMADVPGYYLSPIIEKFPEIFEKWVQSIIICKDDKIANIPHFDRTGMFLSFNYTETLELLYNVPRNNINYIHGRRLDSHAKLIVGHRTQFDVNTLLSPDVEPHKDEAYDEMVKLVNKLKKPLQSVLNGEDCTWHSLANVDKIVVYGHSLNEIDMPYFEDIMREISNTIPWHISIFFKNETEEKSEKGKVVSFCERLGILNYDIFKMPQFED